MCELKWCPNVFDGLFELEILNVKDPASRNTLSARDGLGVLMRPCMPVMWVSGWSYLGRG